MKFTIFNDRSPSEIRGTWRLHKEGDEDNSNCTIYDFFTAEQAESVANSLKSLGPHDLFYKTFMEISKHKDLQPIYYGSIAGATKAEILHEAEKLAKDLSSIKRNKESWDVIVRQMEEKEYIEECEKYRKVTIVVHDIICKDHTGKCSCGWKTEINDCGWHDWSGTRHNRLLRIIADHCQIEKVTPEELEDAVLFYGSAKNFKAMGILTNIDIRIR